MTCSARHSETISAKETDARNCERPFLLCNQFQINSSQIRSRIKWWRWWRLVASTFWRLAVSRLAARSTLSAFATLAFAALAFAIGISARISGSVFGAQ